MFEQPSQSAIGRPIVEVDVMQVEECIVFEVFEMLEMLEMFEMFDYLNIT